MSASQPSGPQFGQNGAVLNAATMTPEFRRQLEAAENPAHLWSLLLPVCLIGSAWLLVQMKPAIFDRISAEDKLFWGGWIAGVACLAYLGNVARTLRQAVARYELRSPPAQRQLELPTTARWMFAFVDTGLMATYGLIILWWLPLPSATPELKVDLATSAFVGAALLFVIQVTLRKYATKRGWIWQRQSS